mgnify:CR=1 FL=1
MGYGGSRRDAGRAIGKSGDGGIDGIIKEPVGGAHANIDEACRIVKTEVVKHLDKLVKVDADKLVERRIKKFCDMGVVLKAKSTAKRS